MIVERFSEEPLTHRQISRSIRSSKTKKIIAIVKILNEALWFKEDIWLKTWFTWPRISFKNNNSIFCFFFLVVLPQTGVVSINHCTTVRSVDSAGPIRHGPIVHENNRAPCRLNTPPAETIGHRRTIQCVDCTRTTGHGSIAQQVRLCTIFIEHIVRSVNQAPVNGAPERFCTRVGQNCNEKLLIKNYFE